MVFAIRGQAHRYTKNQIHYTAVAAPTQLRGSEFCTLTEKGERHIIGSYGTLKVMQEQTSESKYHKKNLYMFINL